MRASGEMQQPPSRVTSSGQQWVIAFVVCNFNVDIGPEVELVFPPQVPFSTADLSAICFNSFPEHQTAETVEDMAFSFSLSSHSPDIRSIDSRAPLSSSDILHGTCIFRQEFDSAMKRSFNQRTLVLVSHHCFHALSRRIVRQVAASGHIGDATALENAYSQISSWPAPRVGRQTVSFMGAIIEVDIAPHPSFPLQGLPGPASMTKGEFSTTSAYQPLGSWDRIMHFMPCISDLYVLFEKLVLCESIVIVTNSPQMATEAVSSLIDLVRPIPYAGVVKPYMTMQSDFRSIGMDGGTPRPFVVGITNPFLLKRIVNAVDNSHHMRPHILYLQTFEGPVPAKRHHSLHRRLSRNALLDLPGGGIEAHAPSKRYIKTESTMVSAVESLLRSQHHTQDIDSLVRRHFGEVCAQFLAPLNRYLTTTNVTSPGGNQHYASFSIPDFLHNLAKHGTSVRFRGQGPIQKHHARDGLYQGFCRSPNFYSWLEMKTSLEEEASASMQGTTKPAVS